MFYKKTDLKAQLRATELILNNYEVKLFANNLDKEQSNIMKRLWDDFEVKKRQLEIYKDDSSKLFALTENIKQYRYLLKQIIALSDLKNQSSTIFQQPVSEALKAGLDLANQLIMQNLDSLKPESGYSIKSNSKDIKMVADTFRYIRKAITDPKSINSLSYSELLTHNNKLLIKAKKDDLWKRVAFWAWGIAIVTFLSIGFSLMLPTAGASVLLAAIVSLPLLLGAGAAEDSRLKNSNKLKYNFLNQLQNLNREIKGKIPEVTPKVRF